MYRACMGRTSIDLDDSAVEIVMARFNFSTKREAVNFALRALAAESLTVDQARSLRGSGWEADLPSLRESRTASS